MFVQESPDHVKQVIKLYKRVKEYISAPFIDAVYCGTEGQFGREARITVIVNSMAVIPAILAMIMAPILYLVYDDFLLLYSPYVEAAILFMVPALNRFKEYKMAKFLVFATHCFGIVYFGIIIGQVANIEIIMIWLIGLSFQIFPTKKERIGAWIVVLACLVFFVVEYQFTFVRTLILTSGIFLNFIVMHFFTEYYQAELKTKSDQFNTVTHEARNIISSLKALSEKWRKLEVTQDGMISIPVNDFNKMRRTILSLADINNNTLDYEQYTARTPKFERLPINITSIFHNVIDVYESFAEFKGIKIELLFDPKAPDVIIGDRTVLKTIISNLLTNAIKYSSPNTTIVITWRKAGKFLFFNVSDSGPGIELDQQDRIWMPYVKSKNPDFPSSGLGLSLIKEMIDQLGGEIQLDSEVGRGSIFSVFIPAEWYESIISAVSIEKKIGMVIDDNYMSLREIANMLHDIGCRTYQVPIFTIDGYRDITHKIESELRQNMPDFVVIDNKIDKTGTGLEVIKELKSMSSFEHIPFILLTGENIPQEVWKSAGASALITKGNCTKEDLIYYIQTSLSKFA